MDMQYLYFIGRIRNISGAYVILLTISFHEELFNLEHATKPLVRKTKSFESLSVVQIDGEFMKFHCYDTRDTSK